MSEIECVEIDRLRTVQRECAAAALAAQIGREREYAMLGVNDNLVEELMLLYWMDAISRHAEHAD